jgi:molecular chaperone Hsp33
MNSLVRFMFEKYQVRGQIVRLDDAWREVAQRHRQHDGRDLAPTVRYRLGEMSAAGLLLAASLKFDGGLVVQIQGAGPVALFVVECEANGTYRATAKVRPDAHVPHDASLNDLVNQDNGGRFAVTLVPGRGEDDAAGGRSRERGRGSASQARLSAPYQGIVPFEGDTVAEVLERYMERSEQIPTRLWLAADDNAAFGLLLQRMPHQGGKSTPGFDEDGWQRVTTLAQTLTRAEMLELPVEAVLQRLFWECPLTPLEQRAPAFACTCSREKVGAMLKMLGRPEVDSILAERGEVAVTCEFCNNDYRFDAVDSAQLFTPGVVPQTPPGRH